MNQSQISFKSINQLAIPAIFAGIVEPLISLTDTAVAGRLPVNAEEALGAIGLVGSFLSAMVWIFLQTSNALSAMVAQAVGKEKVDDVRPLVSQLFLFNIIVGIILALITYLFSEKILTIYGANQSLLVAGQKYFNIRVWGFPLTLLTFTIFGVFKGLQNTRWAMYISFLGGIINVVLDIYLVFYVGMNVEGIAWASLAAQGVMFVLALIYLFKKTPFRLNQIRYLHPDFKKTLGMSFNLFIRTLSLNIALFLAFRFATVMGDGDNKYVAAHALLIQIWLFSAFVLDGYSTAGSAMAGRLLGANRLDIMNIMINKIVKIVLVIGIVLSIGFFILYYPIGRLLSNSEPVLEVFYSAFWVVAFMQPLNAIAFFFDGVYKGLGKTAVLRNVFLLALLIGFIPSIYTFDYFSMGMQGIWFSFVIWILMRAGGLIFHYRNNYLNFRA